MSIYQLWSQIYIIPSWKQNVPWLNPRNVRISLRDSCFGLLEGTECTAAWCSVDNWQPLTCGVYLYGELKELKESNEEQQVVWFFLNLNQQFIMQGMRAVCDSYIVTTYSQTQITWKIKRTRWTRKEKNKYSY